MRAPASSTFPTLAILIALALLAGCEPQDRRPGTWLSGDVVESGVSDWSFANDHQEVLLETRPWYGIPFSVTVVIASRNGKVFIPSIYDEPLPFPGTKYWNGVIASNPDVRVKIGDELYPMRAIPAADGDEFEEGIAALAAKYPFWQQVRETGEPPFAIIRLHPAHQQ